jgi:hypothetical protein
MIRRGGEQARDPWGYSGATGVTVVTGAECPHPLNVGEYGGLRVVVDEWSLVVDEWSVVIILVDEWVLRERESN